MYKRIFVLLISILFLPTIHPQVVQNSDGLWYKGNELFTGTDTTYYSSGQKEVVRTLKDGKQDGKHNIWYDTGQIKEDGLYKDGLMNGEWIYYYENGGVKGKGHFVEGDRTDINKLSGIPDNGKDGNWVYYYKNGQTWSIENYKDGGKHSQWYDNGQVRTERVLKAGLTDGEWTRYYENGVILWLGYYVGVDIANLGENWGSSINGRDGLWIFNHENGKKKSEGTWKDGNLEGISTLWYENGQKKSEATLKDGKPDGMWTFWYDNGQKQVEATYNNGKKIGKWTFYNEDGTVKEIKDFGEGE